MSELSGRIVVEISVESLGRAIAAESGGASRIELCGSLEVGGVTPGVEMMRAVRARVTVPVFAMVRPRNGNFAYSAVEFEEMRRSIEDARDAGMDGVVLGLLRGDGKVDVERTRELVHAATPLPVTFHRAIDESADLFQALEDVIATEATRVLTSGGAAKAPGVVERIAKLVQQAGSRVMVVPGSGITAGNVGEIVACTGAREIHAGLSSVVAASAVPAEFEAEVRKLVKAVGNSARD
jgi:copper homeostasis protein